MPGRLEQYDDFIQKSQYNVTQKKSIKKVQEKQNKKKLQKMNLNLILRKSEKQNLICFIFYSKGGKQIKRQVVVISKSRSINHLAKSNRMYMEVIDVISLTRKLFKKNMIIKASLSNKPSFNLNKDTIGYKK